MINYPPIGRGCGVMKFVDDDIVKRRGAKARLAVRTADKEDQIARLICPTGQITQKSVQPFP